MKFEKQIEAFIEMRIEGKSFDEIATTLKTTKQTLIEWNKQILVKDAINHCRAMKINTIVKTYQFDIENRLNSYLQLSKKINNELMKRDLFKVSTEVLLKMSIANDARVKELVNKNIQIGFNENEICFDNGNGFFNFSLDE